MAPKPLGVGIIGGSPDRGWAVDAHIPALDALGELYKLTAVATSRPESAKAAEQKFGVKAYSDHRELVADPEVDVVVVSVKVPEHFKLVSSALESGKRVICEWPLGNGAAEAAKLAEEAAKRGIPNLVGLQARSAPAFNYIRDLIREGFVGEIMSTSVIGSGNFPAEASVPSFYSYLLDRKNGATTLTIPFSHFTDAMQYALGREFVEVSANLAVRRPKVPVVGGGELEATAHDQISVSGVLEGGAPATVAFKFYRSPGANFLWEINGTKGDLSITGPSGHVQMFDVEIKGSQHGKALEAMPVPEKFHWVPAGVPKGSPFNVAQAYVQVADDWAGKEVAGRSPAPTFADAVKQHRFVEAIEAAAETGIKHVRGSDGLWKPAAAKI
ncbi:hypothetical protein DFJ74DRAFT_11632 [Hyaloraphidium curvatum]|nr:hypothetical protein DFJ74DRAFT_11632 [Hyaloraphidium curvatum]